MILPASTIVRATREFGLSVSRLCGSNDLQANFCPDPTFCDLLPLTEDGKAFLALVEEERLSKE
jgi:hypothetical protein